MPVVTVAAAPHDRQRELLCGVADAIGDALELEPGDVIAIATTLGTAVTNNANTSTVEPRWIIISIHGSDRGATKIAAAREAAARSAADWSRRNRTTEEEVWCEWILPQHP